MAKLLLNANGKVLMKDDKVYKAPESTLKKLLDTTKSCYYLFNKYQGKSVDDLISYNDTENVTNTSYMFNHCSKVKKMPLLNTSQVTTMQSMFAYCNALIEVPQLDTSKVTIMQNMFSFCPTLISVPQLDTSQVTNMQTMFANCCNLPTVPQLNTSNVTNMQSMFSNCYELIEVPQLDTSQVTNMQTMFSYCSKLQTIDITSLDKVTSTNYLRSFATDCYSLTKVIIRTMTVIPSLNTNSFTNCYHFDGTVNATYNPDGLKDGRIYVPDDYVEQLKQATNWSAYADIIVPLSTLEE